MRWSRLLDNSKDLEYREEAPPWCSDLQKRKDLSFTIRPHYFPALHQGLSKKTLWEQEAVFNFVQMWREQGSGAGSLG